MSFYLIYLLMAALAAAVVLLVTRRLVLPADKLLIAFLPLCLVLPPLGAYFFFGHPDLPAQYAMPGHEAEVERRRNMMLAVQPMEVLLHQNPEDLGALAASLRGRAA